MLRRPHHSSCITDDVVSNVDGNQLIQQMPFYEKPSRGTWMLRLPRRSGNISDDEISQVDSDPLIQQVPFHEKPSTGTWLLRLPRHSSCTSEGGVRKADHAQIIEQVPFHQKPSTGTWVFNLPRHNLQPVIMDVDTAKPEEQDIQWAPFHKLPSVGTWMVRFPHGRHQYATMDDDTSNIEDTLQHVPFSLKPSIGTWMLNVPRSKPPCVIVEETKSVPHASKQADEIRKLKFEWHPSTATWFSLRCLQTDCDFANDDKLDLGNAVHMPEEAMLRTSNFALLPSTGSWLAPLQYQQEELEEKDNQEHDALAHVPFQEDELEEERPRFELLPSAGTWLAKRGPASRGTCTKAEHVKTPEEAMAPNHFALLPSTGTWLLAVPCKQEELEEGRPMFAHLPSAGTWFSKRCQLLRSNHSSADEEQAQPPQVALCEEVGVAAPPDFRSCPAAYWEKFHEKSWKQEVEVPLSRPLTPPATVQACPAENWAHLHAKADPDCFQEARGSTEGFFPNHDIGEAPEPEAEPMFEVPPQLPPRDEHPALQQVMAEERFQKEARPDKENRLENKDTKEDKREEATKGVQHQAEIAAMPETQEACPQGVNAMEEDNAPEAEVEAAPVYPLGFTSMPSAGTWLMHRTHQLQWPKEILVDQPEAVCTKVKFSHKPSVGTWLMPPLKMQAKTPALLQVGAFSELPSIGTWVLPLPSDSLHDDGVSGVPDDDAERVLISTPAREVAAQLAQLAQLGSIKSETKAIHEEVSGLRALSYETRGAITSVQSQTKDAQQVLAKVVVETRQAREEVAGLRDMARGVTQQMVAQQSEEMQKTKEEIAGIKSEAAESRHDISELRKQSLQVKEEISDVREQAHNASSDLAMIRQQAIEVREILAMAASKVPPSQSAEAPAQAPAAEAHLTTARASASPSPSRHTGHPVQSSSQPPVAEATPERTPAPPSPPTFQKGPSKQVQIQVPMAEAPCKPERTLAPRSSPHFQKGPVTQGTSEAPENQQEATKRLLSEYIAAAARGEVLPPPEEVPQWPSAQGPSRTSRRATEVKVKHDTMSQPMHKAAESASPSPPQHRGFTKDALMTTGLGASTLSDLEMKIKERNSRFRRENDALKQENARLKGLWEVGVLSESNERMRQDLQKISSGLGATGGARRASRGGSVGPYGR